MVVCLCRFYGSEKEQCLALAECLKTELAELVRAGCTNIQIDEPLLARKPEEALDYGIDILTDILATLPESVCRLDWLLLHHPL